MSDEVRIPLVTRVEGHGNVSIYTDGEEITDVKFGIHEGPRYFEAIMVGRDWHEVPELAARICGICTVIHAVGAARAVENAARNFQNTEVLENYRNLIVYSSHIQSHILHLYFLAWPDYVGKDSALSAVPEHKELIKLAFKMKGISNELTEMLGGRKVHPCTIVPGRYTKSFTVEDLKKYLSRMKEIIEDLRFTAETFAGLDYPDTTVESDHLALYNGKDIPLIAGDIHSLDGLSFPPEKYRDYISEKVVPPNTTKRSYIDGKPFMVGALPRVNVNIKYLRSEARDYADQLPSRNVNYNNLAQGLEAYHYGLEAIDLVEKMIEEKQEYVPPRNKLEFNRDAEGISMVEAPRGLLLHHYRFDSEGRIKYANVVTPTAYNFEHIEQSLKNHLSAYVSQGDDVLKLEAERVIRAYDPCISCSAHIIRTK